jgi:MFS family permease
VRLFLVSAFLVGFGFDGGIFSVLFNLYILRLGYGPELVGVVNSAGLFAFALFSLPAGLFGNWWGIRRTVMIGLVIILAGAALLPLAEMVPIAWQPGWLAGVYVIVFVGIALYFVNGAPFMMASTAPANREHLFFHADRLMATAAFAGSLVGGVLPAGFARLLGDYAGFSRTLPLSPAGGRAVDRACLANYTRYRTCGSRRQRGAGGGCRPPCACLCGSAAMSWRLFVLLQIIRMLQVCGVATIVVFFNVYLDNHLHAATSTIGTISALGRLIAVPVALLTPLLTRRIGNLNVVVLSCLVGDCGLFASRLCANGGRSRHWLHWRGGIVCHALPGLYELCHAHCAPTTAGRLQRRGGRCLLGWPFTGLALGGGYMIPALGYQSLFLLTAALNLAGAILFWWFFRGFRRKKSERTATPVAPQAAKSIDSTPV